MYAWVGTWASKQGAAALAPCYWPSDLPISPLLNIVQSPVSPPPSHIHIRRSFPCPGCCWAAVRGGDAPPPHGGRRARERRQRLCFKRTRRPAAAERCRPRVRVCYRGAVGRFLKSCDLSSLPVVVYPASSGSRHTCSYWWVPGSWSLPCTPSPARLPATHPQNYQDEEKAMVPVTPLTPFQSHIPLDVKLGRGAGEVWLLPVILGRGASRVRACEE